jgi:SecD/SecF fusion protein
MSIWLKSLLAGCIIAIPVFLLSEKFSNRKIEGKYNIHYTIKAEPETNSKYPFSITKIVQVLGKRLETAGYKHEIKDGGSNTIQVFLYEMEDTLSPAYILTSNGRVQFREIYNSGELVQMLTEAIKVISETKSSSGKKIIAPAKRDSMSKEVSSLLDSIEMDENRKTENEDILDVVQFSQPYSADTSRILIFPSEIGMIKLKDTAGIRKIFKNERVQQVSPADIQLTFGEPKANYRIKEEDWQLPFYFLKTRGNTDKALLENEDISDARQDFDQYGKVQITLQFNEYGTRKWSTMTSQNIGRSIAIVINGSVISAPNVLSAIENGTSSITGNYTVQEANALCLGLRSNRLPTSLTITSATIKPVDLTRNTTQKLLITLISFIVFTCFAFFIFKTLKST